jgi:D-alanyl-D-alanine carboxypeptidase (penicillin-binding protein 5/6)
MQPRRRAIRLARAFAVCLASALLALCGLAAASAGARPSLALAAREALLVDTDTGTTLFALHPNREVPIASTTKLMTAYVTLEFETLNHMVVERPYDADDGSDQSLAGLPVGAHYSIADMLRAMLLPSGNDVAHSLALDVGGTRRHFLALMNAAARKLGLTHTHYTTPVGLDSAGNYSSADDLETLAVALMRDPFFAAVVRERSAYLPHGIEVNNTNDLLAYHFVVGIKTGHTLDAGYCLVGAGSRDGVHLISVVLGDPSEAARDDDTLTLLRYGLHRYDTRRIALKGGANHRRATARTPPTPTREGAFALPSPSQLEIDLLYALASATTAFVGGCSLRSMRRRATEASRPRTRA